MPAQDIRKRLEQMPLPGTGTPANPSAQRPFGALARLDERSVAEGNTAELPLFVLSNKEAFPTRGKNDDGSPKYHPDDYRRVYEIAPGATLTIEASIHHGFPTVFAMRVLYAILEKARALDFPARAVPITLAEIARNLGEPAPNGRLIELLKQAVLAMATETLLFENTWYDIRQKKRVATTGGEHIITSFQLGSAEFAARAGQLTLPPCADYVELGERFFQSAKSGYRVGIDLPYLNSLSRDTARRLYVYLTKNDGAERPSHVENIMKLAKKIGITQPRPAAVRRTLEDALAELRTPTRDNKACVASFEFTGKASDTELVVYFANRGLVANVRAAAAALKGLPPAPTAPDARQS